MDVDDVENQYVKETTSMEIDNEQANWDRGWHFSPVPIPNSEYGSSVI